MTSLVGSPMIHPRRVSTLIRRLLDVLMNSKDGKMKWEKFEPKPFEEDDVDIKVESCGICGSDLHVLRSGQ